MADRSEINANRRGVVINMRRLVTISLGVLVVGCVLLLAATTSTGHRQAVKTFVPAAASGSSSTSDSVVPPPSPGNIGTLPAPSPIHGQFLSRSTVLSRAS